MSNTNLRDNDILRQNLYELRTMLEDSRKDNDRLQEKLDIALAQNARLREEQDCESEDEEPRPKKRRYKNKGCPQTFHVIKTVYVGSRNQLKKVGYCTCMEFGSKAVPRRLDAWKFLHHDPEEMCHVRWVGEHNTIFD